MIVEAILWAGGIVVGYAIVANRMMAFSEPLRMESIELAASLVADERFPDHRKRQIEVLMPWLVSARSAWTLVGALPLAACATLFKASRRDAAVADPLADLPTDLRRKWRALRVLSLVAALSASPLAALIFATLFALGSFIVSGAVLADSVFAKTLRRGDDSSHTHGPQEPLRA